MEKKIEFVIEEYEHPDQLSDEEMSLIKNATQAIASSYAPYSDFHVGAAVLLVDGTVVKGSNQENAAYPSGLCAERVAVFSASSAFPGKKIKAIAISAFSKHADLNEPLAPCGACRQVITEYEHLYRSPIRVIMYGNSGKTRIFKSAKDLLPYVFQSEHLGL
jgi:cytidine deaminase